MKSADNPGINKKIVVTVIVFLSLVTILTKYYGSTDTGDYSDISKYFAGSYAAKIRSSHSYLYGTLHFPLLMLFKNFIMFKITSLIFLLLLVYSVYLASEKNKNCLWLMLLSPVVWYLSPWINPIQLSSLLFFLGYYSIKKYEKTEKLKFLFFSGIFIGLSWAFWDAIVFFSLILALVFLYNKKFYHFFLFSVFIVVGLLPKLLLDQFLLGFAFSGLMRYFFSIVAAVFFKGVYGAMEPSNIFTFLTGLVAMLIFIPLFTYKISSKTMWKENKKAVLFIALVLLIILRHMQIRYLLLIVPIIIFEVAPKLNPSQVKRYLILFVIIDLIVIFPYIIQIKYSTNAEEFSSLLANFDNINILENQEALLIEDLKSLEKDFPGRAFVIGNANDNYQLLARIYWGNKVKEFVSIEDYNLFFENKTILFEKKFMPVPGIEDRRQIWISGGINKNENDETDYESIEYGISIGEPLKLENFSFVKRYNLLYVSKKSSGS